MPDWKNRWILSSFYWKTNSAATCWGKVSLHAWVQLYCYGLLMNIYNKTKYLYCTRVPTRNVLCMLYVQNVGQFHLNMYGCGMGSGCFFCTQFTFFLYAFHSGVHIERHWHFWWGATPVHKLESGILFSTYTIHLISR